MICRFSRVGSLYYAVLVCLLLLLCHGKAQDCEFNAATITQPLIDMMAPLGSNATFECQGNGDITWRVRGTQITAPGPIQDSFTNAMIFVPIGDIGVSQLVVTATEENDRLPIACIFNLLSASTRACTEAEFTVFGSGPDNGTATTQPPTTESPTIETDSGSGVDEVSSGSLLGCVAAGFTGCCEPGSCRTASGCFCDFACYSAGDCCPDIIAAGCLLSEPVVFGLEPQLLSVTEGTATEVCVELLAGNITDPVTVNVRTVEGLRQTDFVIGLGSIVFVAGDARKCSQVQTIDDSSFEETETFQIVLNSTSSNVEILLNRSSADILIADNDVVLLAFVEPFKTVPEAAGTVQLCVELQGGELQLPVRVRVQSNDITAEAGSDYSEVLQLLIFHIGGNTTQCFNVEIIDDASAETDETFRLSLATESVAVVAYSEAQLTIVDNEIPLMLSFRNDTPLVVGNDVTLAFAANMPLASAECAITGSNQGSRDCTDGFAEFKNINPSRRGAFTIDVTAVGTSGQSAKLTSTFRSETAGDCSAHLINEGLTVGASGAVSVQWQATGPTAANRNTDFRCTVDDNAPVNCVSPYEVEVGAGEHTLTVRPIRNELCRRIIPLMLGPFQI